MCIGWVVDSKNFKLHPQPFLRFLIFIFFFKPCYHVGILRNQRFVPKTPGRFCDQIRKSRIHFFPSPNATEASGLSCSPCRHPQHGCHGARGSSKVPATGAWQGKLHKGILEVWMMKQNQMDSNGLNSRPQNGSFLVFLHAKMNLFESHSQLCLLACQIPHIISVYRSPKV